MKYFITSDIHSFYTELQHALDKAGFDINNEDHVLVVCGDLFDRGDETIQLYEFVRSLPENRFIYVRGNHEDLLEDCVNSILNGDPPGGHHISNGTIKTIDAFLNHGDPKCSLDAYKALKTIVVPIIEWINTKTVDYYEIGDKYICTHGWVPCICDDLNIYHARKNMKLAPLDWWDSDENYDATQVWEEARWLNGMNAWKQGAKLEGKTIICGHWHCSYGHAHIHQDRKEFPQKNKKDWQKSFEPFMDDGIIAIDSCCVHSNFLNCIVIETQDDDTK